MRPRCCLGVAVVALLVAPASVWGQVVTSAPTDTPTTDTPTDSPTASTAAPTAAPALSSPPSDAPSANVSGAPTDPGNTSTLSPTESPTTSAEAAAAEVFRPNGPCVLCDALPDEFLLCALPSEQQCNFARLERAAYTDVPRVTVSCTVLDGVVCFAEGTGCDAGDSEVNPRNVTRAEVPCVLYSGRDFVSTLLVSMFFGWTGADRFMLGYTSLGLVKLFTLGALGTWWIVDLLLLSSGTLVPADGAQWDPYY